MHGVFTGELAKIRQAELIAEADRIRLAKAVREADTGTARARIDVRALVTAIRDRFITRTRETAVR